MIEHQPSDDRTLASIMTAFAVAESILPVALPTRIGPDGRYELTELIAYTPSSRVYIASDHRFTQDAHRSEVVVKVSNRGERGLVDALSARRVDSPYVTRVLDRGEDPEGRPFLVLEHVRGGDLSKASVPFPPRKAAVFVAQLAAAVQAAHSVGVVHCDLKPANVLLTENGEPRLTDFDLSLRISDETAGPRGNRAFAAPEQWEQAAENLSSSADIYGLGGILYYLLSGLSPNGSTLNEADRISTGLQKRLNISAPAPLQAILDKALKINRSERYATAEDLRDDLEAWLAHRPVSCKHYGPIESIRLFAQRRPAMALLSAMVMLASITIPLLFTVDRWREKERQIQTAREANTLANLRIDQLTKQRREQIMAMAKGLASVGNSGSLDQLWIMTSMIRQLEDSAPLELDGTSFAPAHIVILERFVNTADQSGRSRHVDVLIVRLALAKLLLQEKRVADAARVLDIAEQHWPESMPDTDPLRGILRALKNDSRS